MSHPDVEKGQPGSRVQRLVRAIAQTRAFSAVLAWFFLDVFRTFRRWVIFSFLSLGVGLGFSALALALVIGYANALEKRELIEFGELAIDPWSQGTLLVAASLGLLLFLSGFTLIYIARRNFVSIACAYQAFSIRRVSWIEGGRPPSPDAFMSLPRLYRSLASLQARDSRQIVLAVRRLFDGVVPVLIILAATAVLFWLHLPATLMVVVTVILAARFYYAANLSAVKASRRLERVSPEASAASRQRTRTVSRDSGVASDNRRLVENDQVFADKINAMTAAFRERFSAVVRAEYISHVLLAIGLSALIVILGGDVLRGESTWTLMIAYIFVLRIAMAGLRQLSTTITTISRFYPGMQRYYRFMRESELNRGRSPYWSKRRLSVGAPALTEKGRKRIVLSAGLKVALISPVPPVPAARAYFSRLFRADRAAGGGDPVSLGVLPRHSIPERVVSFREMVGIPVDLETLASAGALKEDLAVLATQAGTDLSRPILPAQWESLGEACLNRLAFVALLVQPSACMVIHAGLLRDEWVRDRLEQSKWQDRLIVIWYRKLLSSPPRLSLDQWLVGAADCSIIAVGSYNWLRVKQPDWQARQRDIAEQLRVGNRLYIGESQDEA
ncbi:hypothetical protein [Natronospira bacteriovora]|uniref:ABC transmembrane type-1 domain-containing protein n=1 Tax=Natronospira bacteriovora TaxID=3069753 RepID=A0ABU0W8W6_9GAMM|nr:hypothetical protein [Natronospira sp. AB-CW4]MDQ2069895.1 hypothetical protein [Natronospira sp. AB-CW4]